MALFSESGGQRRRRVLTEQVITSTDGPASSGSPSPRVKRRTGPSYSTGALASQPSVTQFVPQRRLTLAMLALLVVLAATGLAALDLYRSDWNHVLQPEHGETLDMTRRGSLANWFSAALLGMCGAGSLVIYSVRRHKVDDYQGRYRVWIWAAAVWTLCSVNAVARLHLLLVDVLVHLTKFSGWGDGLVWWLGPGVVLFGAVAVRAAIDLRACRMALMCFTLAATCWGASLAIELGGVAVPPPLAAGMVAAATVLASHVLVWLSLLFYARHVILDADGRLPKREPKKKAPKPEVAAGEAAGDKAKKLAVDPPHKSPSAPLGRTDLDAVETRSGASRQNTLARREFDDDEPNQNTHRKISKAERRRLRKQHSQF